MKILANDGIDSVGKKLLEEEGITVITEKIKQEELIDYLNDGNFDGIVVRSATKVRADLIKACPTLKVIGRAGVGLDNIDVAAAQERGITVLNTPDSSSQSVAELVFSHFYSIARQLQSAHLEMPSNGNAKFNELKKAYSAGVELKGKTLGIVGFGRIGQAVARIGIGSGMKIKAYDPFLQAAELDMDLFGIGKITVEINTGSFNDLITQSDFITLHVPHKEGSPALIGSDTIAKMKKGVILVNAARGGVIDEAALYDALESGQVAGAGLDVFVNEPTPSASILKHPKVSATPHIGASTLEAQERIGVEMARKIIDYFKKN